MNTEKAIVTSNLTKQFGRFTAVHSVNLTVNPGEIYALVGPNGAGKTTLLKMLVGLLTPTSGSATIYGFDPARSPIAAKRTFAYISDDPSAYGYLTGKEFLTLTGRLRGLSAHALDIRIKELLPIFPLEDIIHQPQSQYSRGNKQKIAFLSALIASPKLLIIDEPVVGMDIHSIDMMGRVLKAYAHKGNAVLLVTHILDFAKKYAHRAGIMKEGTLERETLITKSTSLEKLL